MRSLLAALLLPALCLSAIQAEEPKELPKIREFEIKTIEALGQELYKRDHLASDGTDLLFATHPEAKGQSIRGWVSILGEDASTVYFVRQKEDVLSMAYSVTFPREGKPTVKDQVGEALPESVRTRFLARQTAMAAVPKLYTPQTNAEVLDDPAGKGFLVYVLASTDEPNKMVVGGHYRVTVSADGRKAEAVDALSRSLLILPINSPDVPKGAETVAAFMSHVVSPTPVETHVFVSLLHRKTFFVATSPTDIWKVENGTITKTEIKP
ncbi:MAG TPA: hypothetical protein VK961_23465 [Chthoniobacter sp.]|nr:hypothetical protein [Chthoniobacter sp.]